VFLFFKKKIQCCITIINIAAEYILEKRFDSFKQKKLRNVESFKMTATPFAFNFMLFIGIDGQHLLLFLHLHKTLYRLQAQYKIVLTCPFYRFQMQ
jgi:hypothetical protein